MYNRASIYYVFEISTINMFKYAFLHPSLLISGPEVAVAEIHVYALLREFL
jgi:hypothetical protein